MQYRDKTSEYTWSDIRIEGIDETRARIEVTSYEDTTALENAIKRVKEAKADSKLGRLQATIPMSIYLELMKTGVANDPPAFRKWLNDPDNRVWRRSGGKL